MSELLDGLKLPQAFTGIVRLFPLPNLVMFPGVMQPLHIFEPRYRQMTADSLAADQLIAMALMKPGWEPQYEAKPAVFSTVCVGRIMTHSRLEDGRYNVLLHGLRRATIVREIPTDRMYRMAEVALPAQSRSGTAAQLSALFEKVKRKFRRLCRRDKTLDEEACQSMFGDTLSPEILADLVAFSLDVAPPMKQRVLAENDVTTRLLLVAELLDRLLAPSANRVDAGFPPCFSSN
jgi:Lon protease-like protein